MGVAAPRLRPEFGFSTRIRWVRSSQSATSVSSSARRLGGWLADRVGRKAVFIGAVATFGVFTLGVALANSFSDVGVLRFLAGLGFGGALPNMMAMATELSAPSKRAQTAAIMFSAACRSAAVSRAWSRCCCRRDIGWRSLFVVGGICPLLWSPRCGSTWRRRCRRRGTRSRSDSAWHILFREGRAVAVSAAVDRVPADGVNPVPDPQLVAVVGGGERIRCVGRAAVSDRIQFRRGGRRNSVRLVDKFGTRTPLVVAYIGLIGTLVCARRSDQPGDDEFSAAWSASSCSARTSALRRGPAPLPAGDARHRQRVRASR